MYLSGPFELARVLVEKKDNASFDLYHEIQGNLLNGIDNKTVRGQGISKLHTLFTYVLLSVTHIL